MDISSIKDEFNKYAERMLEIRKLSSPDIKKFDNSDDYSKRFDYGLSLTLTDRDRVVFGQAMDVERHSVRDIDYYWFHDMHCAQFIVHYRAKRDSWHVKCEFTPW